MCDDPSHSHVHAHGPFRNLGHEHGPLQVQVERRVLESNDVEAQHLREDFAEDGTLVVNLISSPGSGKTTLLEATVAELKGKLSVGVIEGDVATERDAGRIRALGVPAFQVVTGGACHLDARQVNKALRKGKFPDLDVLFIENVGNLVCPTSYDLGEDFKAALLSVTEGDDKPFKYPGIFSAAQVTLITKTDLMPHVSFDLEAVKGQIKTLRPGGEVLMASAQTGTGVDAWCGLLAARLASKRAQHS